MVCDGLTQSTAADLKITATCDQLANAEMWAREKRGLLMAPATIPPRGPGQHSRPLFDVGQTEQECEAIQQQLVDHLTLKLDEFFNRFKNFNDTSRLLKLGWETMRQQDEETLVSWLRELMDHARKQTESWAQRAKLRRRMVLSHDEQT
jgi:hypothetical protein